MPNINLIAARREEKKRMERITRQLFFGVAGSLGFLVTLSLFMGAQRLESGSRLTEIEAKMQKLQPVLDEIAQVKKETDELTPKVTTLRDAHTGTQKWRAILQVVSGAVPDQTWLSSITATGIGDDTTVSMMGISTSQSRVGETMTHLGVHPLFDKVELRFTQAVQTQTGDTAKDQRIQFQIDAHLRSAPKPPEGKDGKPAEEGDKKTAQSTPEGNRSNA